MTTARGQRAEIRTPTLSAVPDMGDYGTLLYDKSPSEVRANVVGECIPQYSTIIIRAVNSHDALIEKLEKVAAWLDRLSDQLEQQASRSHDHLPGFSESCRADAKNYRLTVSDIRAAILKASQ